MSCVVGCFRPREADPATRSRAAFARLEHRGTQAVHEVSTPNGVLAVGRFTWECRRGLAGPATVSESGDWAAAADASLYYQADIRGLLRHAGHEVADRATPCDLILAAFLEWGPDCLSRLEGDYALVIWNRATDEVFAARDFAGSRPLYWAEVDDSIAISSGAEATLAIAGLDHRLAVDVLACNASGFPGLGTSTHLQGVHQIPAGRYVHWRPGRDRELHQWWSAPIGERPSRLDEAATELRSLLIAAVEERTLPGASNAVWLSGGWDSTAVLGAASQGGRKAQCRAISVSYPDGDPGREDALIKDVAAFCEVPVTWLSSESLPVLAAPERRPFAHAFAGWIRGLAQGARDSGARVSLTGYGGDQLFQTSDVFLADLLRRGRLVELAREWRHPRWRGQGRSFLRWAVKPAIPERMLARLIAWRGGIGSGCHLERRVPPWVTPTARAAVADGLATIARAPGEDHAIHETRWYLTDPYFPAINAEVAEIALGSGTEMRAPLMDERIVRLALSRPQEERSSRGETKRLLRRAVRGLLPDAILDSRVRRTGTTEVYFRRALRKDTEWVAELFRDSRLGDLGLIRPEVFLRWWEWFNQGGSGTWDAALSATVQAERWIQETERRGNATNVLFASVVEP